eukprot:752016-Amorphochlora_amoeboformis.AAC.1
MSNYVPLRAFFPFLIGLICINFPKLASGEYVNATLVNGKPYILNMRSGGDAHLQMEYSHSATEALSMVVTPFSGEPDLYANVRTPGWPSRGHADYAS